MSETCWVTLKLVFYLAFCVLFKGPEFAICPQDVELNRRSDAWIPRQATSQILSGIASSAPGASYPDRSALTAPAAAIREGQFTYYVRNGGGVPKMYLEVAQV